MAETENRHGNAVIGNLIKEKGTGVLFPRNWPQFMFFYDTLCFVASKAFGICTLSRKVTAFLQWKTLFCFRVIVRVRVRISVRVRVRIRVKAGFSGNTFFAQTCF